MILFVDDEPRIMDSYRQYLEIKLAEKGKQLVFFSKVDEAVEFYEKNRSELELLILDLMMPFGKEFSREKSNGGLKTGLLFYQKVRNDLPQIPILLFTNSIDEDVEAAVKKDDKAEFLQKKNYSLEDLLEEVLNNLLIPE